MMPLISVIILNWNGKRFLKECLDSLAAQSLRDFETVLVDNGSHDGSSGYVQEHYPWVKLVNLPKNIGFAAGNNRGLAECHGKFVVTLNNDTKAEPGFLAAMVVPALNDPRIGMVAAKMLKYYQPDLIDCMGLKVAANGFGYNVGVGERASGRYGTSQEVFGPCGGAALYRREMVEEVGFFDPDYFAYYEDFDLAWRGRLAGWRSVTAPDALVYHVHSATSGEWSDFKVFHVHRNKWFNIVKNWPTPLLLENLPRLFFYDLLGFLLSILKGRGVSAIKARLQVLFFLPVLVRKRREIQGRRQITAKQAERLFSPAEGALHTFLRKMKA
jgi:GT2 family glycosyltransferase